MIDLTLLPSLPRMTCLACRYLYIPMVVKSCSPMMTSNLLVPFAQVGVPRRRPPVPLIKSQQLTTLLWRELFLSWVVDSGRPPILPRLHIRRLTRILALLAGWFTRRLLRTSLTLNLTFYLKGPQWMLHPRLVPSAASSVISRAALVAY